MAKFLCPLLEFWTDPGNDLSRKKTPSIGDEPRIDVINDFFCSFFTDNDDDDDVWLDEQDEEAQDSDNDAEHSSEFLKLVLDSINNPTFTIF